MKMSFDAMSSFGIIGGIIAIGYAFYQTQKMRNTADKLDMSLEEVSSKTPVDIQQAFVDKVIERAVERNVATAANEAVKSVKNDIRNEIERVVRKEVDAAYKTLSEDVTNRISDQVANIDEYALKDKVVKEAEKKIIQKFDGCLDGVLGDFNRQLNNVNKIYESIGNTLKGKSNETVLRIGG